eukprot:CAMPEP_0115435596 /NCGR_PEP_ID=MMETSP0271-20121206/33747_1 /TAXON_ID=71861 /ORGANISM="Scrippsiella trochoidea, Strain CCMP3099" /LENGTH=125 /DNA_ID=CAMNT_0002861071 /DNA_START=91 /DNA_END=465 /DNA_ORIENTATION=+
MKAPTARYIGIPGTSGNINRTSQQIKKITRPSGSGSASIRSCTPTSKTCMTSPLVTQKSVRPTPHHSVFDRMEALFQLCNSTQACHATSETQVLSSRSMRVQQQHPLKNRTNTSKAKYKGKSGHA